MSSFEHDPSEYIRGLQQLLVSDKKKIAFLFGAGTSLAKKNKYSITVPAIGQLTSDIENQLKTVKEYEIAITGIRREIEAKDYNYNIETLLSNIEQKIQVIGEGNLNGLKLDGFNNLLTEIKKLIREKVSVHNQILDEDKLKDLIHVDFAEWIIRANRKYPIEIFTTNYDYLFELGLEEKSVAFYDGFTASYRPFFNADSVGDMNFIPNQTKLWKIHGSLGWHFDTKTNKVWRKDSSHDDILIYPSTQKYNDSKKQPYTALMDRLTSFLKQPDTILITCGYSFGDEHINERLLSALNTNTSAHVLALYYDIKWNESKKDGYLLTEDSALSNLARSNKKISIYGCRNAVIGGQFGKWKLKREPSKDDTIHINLYFDEDGFSDLDDEIGKEKKGEQTWNGEGELKLSDFSNFVGFLQSMILEDNVLGDIKK